LLLSGQPVRNAAATDAAAKNVTRALVERMTRD
jgi:hypothetical protein